MSRARLPKRTSTDMHRRERARQPDDRTVRMGVGVYRFEDEGRPPKHVVRRRSRYRVTVRVRLRNATFG
jgi:hypothetical protein